MSDLNALLGNEAVRTRLADAIKSGTVPHAFLISGEVGSGKKTLAREFAMALNCERKAEALPCRICNTCKRIAEGNYTDIYTLRKDENKASIGVEEIRAFKDSAMLSPVESDYKVYVIEDAQALTVQAQNALLTFLEEPPRNTYILLLASELDGILTTIKSRAQAISMTRFTKEEMERHLTAISEKARNTARRDPDAFAALVMNSGGVIGRALAALDEGADASTAAVEKVVTAICASSGYAELYAVIKAMKAPRKKFISTLEALLCALRDVMLCRFDEKCVPVFYSTREKPAELAKKISPKRLLSVCDIVTLTIKDASGNVGIDTLITGMATKIKLL